LWFKDFLCCMIFFDKGRRLDHARKDVIAGVDTLENTFYHHLKYILPLHQYQFPPSFIQKDLNLK
ncbi:hypothetical protein, partial [Marinilabilia salmonicolor]|uniref:hypothetical protein n=1 Tax=Marinilabilia salmonicolor TaxID=989 RepID=UPI001C6258F5